jgi:hypothetical protein
VVDAEVVPHGLCPSDGELTPGLAVRLTTAMRCFLLLLLLLFCLRALRRSLDGISSRRGQITVIVIVVVTMIVVTLAITIGIVMVARHVMGTGVHGSALEKITEDIA